MADLFPNPIQSPDLMDLSFNNEPLTPEENAIAAKLGWTQKFSGSVVSSRKLNQVRWLVALLPFLTLLLQSRGGYDVMERVLDYLTAKDIIILAAASDELIMTFVRSSSKIFQRLKGQFESRLCKDQRTCQKEEFFLSAKRLGDLSSGMELLREYRLFKSQRYFWKIDTSTLFSHTYPNLVCYHPTAPIMAFTDHTKNLYILAYGGDVRRERGQILFVDPSPRNGLYSSFRALNWSPDGSYLLALEGPYNKPQEENLVTFRLCKLIAVLQFFLMSLILHFD
jgi:hypothetical protein